jgi:hypothetical protein
VSSGDNFFYVWEKEGHWQSPYWRKRGENFLGGAFLLIKLVCLL